MIPTIEHLRTQGVSAARVSCCGLHCHKMTVMSFDDLRLPETTPFPDIATARRWRCLRCGGRKVQVMPDWPVISGKRI